MPTDLTALRESLLQGLHNVSGLQSHDPEQTAALGVLLSGLAAALAAVRVELDREREATACLPTDDKPDDGAEWTPPPVETVWGLAEWETASGLVYELYVADRDDYIARISDDGWTAYRGPEGLDGEIDRGDAFSIRDAHAQAIAALRAAGSLA